MEPQEQEEFIHSILEKTKGVLTANEFNFLCWMCGCRIQVEKTEDVA